MAGTVVILADFLVVELACKPEGIYISKESAGFKAFAKRIVGIIGQGCARSSYELADRTQPIVHGKMLSFQRAGGDLDILYL